jgi:glycine/D-amino acid oxidase-like deaminating enzyme
MPIVPMRIAPMRIVVVGSGVIGLLTAGECVRAGARVELVDQAGIPGPLATSNDRYRAVRALHRDDEALTLAAARGRQGWADLERMLGARFCLRTGALTVMPEADVTASLVMLATADTPARAVPAEALAQRYPLLRLAAGDAAVFEPVAGMVLASEALHALAGWLGEQPGVTLRPGHQVTAVGESGTVRLADGSVLRGDGVVIAAGPWSRDLLPAAVTGDLTLLRQTMLTYAPSPAWPGMPVVLGLGPDRDAWLMPPAAGTPARLSAASACRAVPAMTGRAVPAPWRDHLTGLFTQLLADFDPARVTGATDGYYLSDLTGPGPRLAGFGDGTVWAYPACGGMSFKFAPLVARALADRALGRPSRPAGLDFIDRPWPRQKERRHEAART